MRVVDTDNFGGDYPNERYVTQSISEAEAKAIAKEYNDKLNDYSPRYWKVVPDNYTLAPVFEP